MTGKGHRIVGFAVAGAATGSLCAAVCAMLGSRFPDSSEYMLWGRNRNRRHRKHTHWFPPYLAAAVICARRAGFAPPTFSALIDGSSDSVLWGCAAMWFAGCLIHIAADAFCGKVPLFLPWKKSFGTHVFRMSPKMGEMSFGEKAFTAFTALSSACVWLTSYPPPIPPLGALAPFLSRATDLAAQITAKAAALLGSY